MEQVALFLFPVMGTFLWGFSNPTVLIVFCKIFFSPDDMDVVLDRVVSIPEIYQAAFLVENQLTLVKIKFNASKYL